MIGQTHNGFGGDKSNTLIKIDTTKEDNFGGYGTILDYERFNKIHDIEYHYCLFTKIGIRKDKLKGFTVFRSK